MSKLHLYYWGTAGKGNMTRLLLEYLQIPYEETRYTQQTANEWFGKDKHQLGYDFPNLPSLIDDQIKISENIVLNQYLPFKANRTDLNGKNIDQFKVQEINNMLNDVFTQIYYASQEQDPTKRLELYKEKIHPKVVYLNNFYTGKEWALGYLTTADFYSYCFVQGLRAVFKDEFDKEFSGVFEPFVKRFEAIPAIAAYIKSQRYLPYGQ